MSQVKRKVRVRIKINVKGNGQECPFHTGVADGRGGRLYMGCGGGVETKIPRFARNDINEGGALRGAEAPLFYTALFHTALFHITTFHLAAPD
jgi:hypothetical protein